MIIPRDQFVRLLSAACDAADWMPYHEPSHSDHTQESDAGRELRDAIEASSRWVAKSWKRTIPDECHGVSAGRFLLEVEEGIPI